ncbi:hypothetical protein HMPREF3223_00332 [Cutibacterium avidum]|nr:hypothetical protein HMPREF3223_00332 [Cutibacterium avidum]
MSCQQCGNPTDWTIQHPMPLVHKSECYGTFTSRPCRIMPVDKAH